MYKVAARNAGFPCCFSVPEDRNAIKKEPSTLHCGNRRDSSRASVELISLILEFSSFNSLERCCFEERGIRLSSGTGLPKKSLLYPAIQIPRIYCSNGQRGHNSCWSCRKPSCLSTWSRFYRHIEIKNCEVKPGNMQQSVLDPSESHLNKGNLSWENFPIKPNCREFS